MKDLREKLSGPRVDPWELLFFRVQGRIRNPARNKDETITKVQRKLGQFEVKGSYEHVEFKKRRMNVYYMMPSGFIKWGIKIIIIHIYEK